MHILAGCYLCIMEDISSQCSHVYNQLIYHLSTEMEWQILYLRIHRRRLTCLNYHEYYMTQWSIITVKPCVVYVVWYDIQLFYIYFIPWNGVTDTLLAYSPKTLDYLKLSYMLHDSMLSDCLQKMIDYLYSCIII